MRALKFLAVTLTLATVPGAAFGQGDGGHKRKVQAWPTPINLDALEAHHSRCVQQALEPMMRALYGKDTRTEVTRDAQHTPFVHHFKAGKCGEGVFEYGSRRIEYREYQSIPEGVEMEEDKPAYPLYSFFDRDQPPRMKPVPERVNSILVTVCVPERDGRISDRYPVTRQLYIPIDENDTDYKHYSFTASNEQIFGAVRGTSFPELSYTDIEPDPSVQDAWGRKPLGQRGALVKPTLTRVATPSRNLSMRAVLGDVPPVYFPVEEFHSCLERAVTQLTQATHVMATH